MQFRDVSHYVSRTRKRRSLDNDHRVHRHPRVPDWAENGLQGKNFLGNFDEFRAKLLTGKTPPGYTVLVDSLKNQASTPAMRVATKNKESRARAAFGTLHRLQTAVRSCGQKHPQLLLCVSSPPVKQLPGGVSLSPQTAQSRRTQGVKDMTSLLRISDVQDRLCVSRSTVNRLIRERKLECLYVGRSPRIPDDAVEKFIMNLRDKAITIDEDEMTL
jgi:excisionase family DNA binding protein